MIYGLYLSANGVLANSRRQDVIANNLANAETVGFRRDSAAFAQRLTAAQEQRRPQADSDPMMEHLGGGMFMMPTRIDMSQGGLESSSNPLDLAIEGDGFFAVQSEGKTRLTRDGRFMLDRGGYLVRANSKGEKVLDSKSRPIQLDGTADLSISDSGSISQRGEVVAKLGLFDVPDRARLTKVGATMLGYENTKSMTPAAGKVRAQFLERSNVDPATEMVQMIDAQRQLEFNANMIRFQDQALGRLVNEVGKIG